MDRKFGLSLSSVFLPCAVNWMMQSLDGIISLYLMSLHERGWEIKSMVVAFELAVLAVVVMGVVEVTVVLEVAVVVEVTSVLKVAVVTSELEVAVLMEVMAVLKVAVVA